MGINNIHVYGENITLSPIFQADLVLMNWACMSLLVVALTGVPPAHAQATDSGASRTQLVLDDGDAWIGVMGSETDSARTVSATGEVQATVKSKRATRDTLLHRERAGRFEQRDPNDTRLIFGPTARALEPGRGHVSVYQVLVPSVAIGVGRSVNLVGGMSLLPTDRGQLVYAAPKITIRQTPRHAVAVGALIGTIVGEERDGFGGLLYGLNTWGRSSGAVTVGAGMVVGNEGAFTNQPLLVMGGEYRVGEHIKLLSENYVFAGDESTLLFSGGIRFFGDTLAAGFSLFSTLERLDDSGGLPFLPFLSFTYHFGR